MESSWNLSGYFLEPLWNFQDTVTELALKLPATFLKRHCTLPSTFMEHSRYSYLYSYSLSSAYPGPARGGSRLSRDTKTSLSPDTSSSSSGESPRRSQTSRET
ncbi:hypothetical protein AMECASPLE_019740 [Ameca splendens]|uniref:Uncharacterized protein n=1 Tax=Ameca splendens TaxID=208324 RepID=A0ABV0XS48_9TELE